MLPRATTERTPRSAQTGGRAQEIQRLIGRSLRAVTDLKAFGERTIILDCDVLEADGGTRTASIDGALVALHDAFVTLSNRGHLTAPPLRDMLGAVSVGMIAGTPCLDLDYREDSSAQVDMNVVMTGAGRFVEVQGTGESVSFSEAELRSMLRLARLGIGRVFASQRRLLGDSLPAGRVTPPDLVLATFNPASCASLPLPAAAGRLRGLHEFEGAFPPVEHGASLLENARLKADAAARLTGLSAIADDTGLEVDALDGAPGLRSARFAGEEASDAENVALLLERMRKVPDGRRGARFHTVCVARMTDGSERVGEGFLEGSIARAPRGAGGFGYDPVFEVAGMGRTLAELDEAAKNAISHRARAARALARLMTGG
jgi:ribonuclease PH/non-canonical purine NTP pyrophosphatase (RdgB/HAM1 family)